MLKIRLARAGRKNMAFFRLVLTEHTAAAKHGYKKVLGTYNPFTKDFNIKSLDEVKKYLSNGAQLSGRVKKLCELNNIEL